jgi:hypothetical protein
MAMALDSSLILKARRTGRLRVSPIRCPNLCAEAKLYRYPTAEERAIRGELPIDDNNHALGALRSPASISL